MLAGLILYLKGSQSETVVTMPNLKVDSRTLRKQATADVIVRTERDGRVANRFELAA